MFYKWNAYILENYACIFENCIKPKFVIYFSSFGKKSYNQFDLNMFYTENLWVEKVEETVCSFFQLVFFPLDNL